MHDDLHERRTEVGAQPGSGRTEGPAPVLCVGLVPPGASGVRDYGRLLAAEMRGRGRSLDETWIENAGNSLRASLSASRRFLRLHRDVSPGTRVIWHYSSFAYGFRGIPLPCVLLGLRLRRQGTEVLTILHEPAYPWGRRGVRGRVQAMSQWVALPLVLRGSTSALVTTARRERDLRKLPRSLRPNVFMAPVFPTVDVVPVPAAARFAAGPLVVGIFGYTGDGARPDLCFQALARLRERFAFRVLLLGSPGSGAADAQRCLAFAVEAGLTDLVTFTEIVPAAELSRLLHDCDVLLLPNEEGPSSRRTNLANALAHGVPLISIDGPDRWDDLVPDGALVLVDADVDALAAAFERLFSDPGERRALGLRGRSSYERRMRLESVADVVIAAVDSMPHK